MNDAALSLSFQRIFLQGGRDESGAGPALLHQLLFPGSFVPPGAQPAFPQPPVQRAAAWTGFAPPAAPRAPPDPPPAWVLPPRGAATQPVAAVAPQTNPRPHKRPAAAAPAAAPTATLAATPTATPRPRGATAIPARAAAAVPTAVAATPPASAASAVLSTTVAAASDATRAPCVAAPPERAPVEPVATRTWARGEVAFVPAGAQQGQRGVVVGVDPDGDVFLKLSDGIRRVFAASQLRLAPREEGEGGEEGAPPSTPTASVPAPVGAGAADPAPAPADLGSQPEAAAPEASSTATFTAPATHVWPEGTRALRSGLEAEPSAASVAVAVALGRFLAED